ncbi:MAG: hypothetical protein V3R73_04020 [Sphingomonadales bacterium]
MADKKRILRSLKDQLKEFEEEIDRMDKKSRIIDKKLREKFSRHQAEFREITKEGYINVERLKEVGEAEFDRFKENVEFTVRALKKAFGVFVEQFNEREKSASESGKSGSDAKSGKGAKGGKGGRGGKAGRSGKKK